MPYKVKNGNVFVFYNGSWWRDEMLYAIYPALLSKGLSNG